MKAKNLYIDIYIDTFKQNEHSIKLQNKKRNFIINHLKSYNTSSHPPFFNCSVGNLGNAPKSHPLPVIIFKLGTQWLSCGRNHFFL